MKKRTIFITGATSGIGKATAELLAEKNYNLILCGRREERLQLLKSELESKTKVHTLNFDVRNYKEVEYAINSLPKDFSEIDILINNAGNAHGLDNLSEGNIEDWDAMMDGNVKGLLYVSRCIIPKMVDRKSGHIVNINSVASFQSYAKGVVYCASKKAVTAISEGMRIELTEFGIKITDVKPGAVQTEFSEVRFKGDTQKADAMYKGYNPLKPEDVADAIFYAINAPNNVCVAEITLYASAQASATTIYRKS